MKNFGNPNGEPKPAVCGNWSRTLWETQHDLKQLRNRLMQTITDLDSAIAALSTAATAITSTVTDLESKLAAAQAAGTPPDLTAEVTKLNALSAALNAATATDPTATPTATPTA